MKLMDLDVYKVTKLVTKQLDQITCLECCKHYIAPETANCGHSLCRECWRYRRTCPFCSAPFERRDVRVNIPLQNLTKNVLTLKDALQKVFNININDYCGGFFESGGNSESTNDPAKNVKDCPATSQNKISVQSLNPAPAQNSSLDVTASNIQIHSKSRRTRSPEKVLHVSIPQDDWDKIETLPGTEELVKNNENVIGPMDYEPFIPDDNEYSTDHPRRSSRHKAAINNSMGNVKDNSTDMSKDSNKAKQDWDNVKRMRKEFSKLNKKNKNKLNVSIEMCKKRNNNKTVELTKASPPQVYEIDENTPAFDTVMPEEKSQNIDKHDMNTLPIIEVNMGENNPKTVQQNIEPENNCKVQSTTAKCISEISCSKEALSTEMPKYERNILHQKCTQKNQSEEINNILLNAPDSDDDIQITVRVGNSITNIYIQKKKEINIKLNMDKAIQTSLLEKNTASNSKIINIHTETQTKSISEKKNTDSADTATIQFESLEKQLSNKMQCAGNNEKQKSDSNSQKSKQDKLPVANIEELEDLNDLDIFESDSVKEQSVQILKDSNYAHSDILIPTAYSKNKTQKGSSKRVRMGLNEKISQNKKPKLMDSQKLINESIDGGHNPKVTIFDSEPMNYDSVMGNVFANIDADIEKMNSQGKTSNHQAPTQKSLNKSFNDIRNQKESENVFSVCILDKEDEKNQSQNNSALQTEINEEDFLTPLGHHVELKGNKEKDSDAITDDSESVVEETPQKNTSIPKLKQKSNGGMKQLSDSQLLHNIEKSISENNMSVVNLTDKSLGLQNTQNQTIISRTNRETLETPLNIHKFVDDITHKSTPAARKSLIFVDDCEDIDPEQTLCTNEPVAKTTQEREFMHKAFEKTPVATIKSFGMKSGGKQKYCIAASCLSSKQIVMVKLFCNKNNFTYADKYVNELTHLVVSVDEENKAQRSVKYMCALAASKWIVSFDWIQKCMEENNVVNEERFEVLDTWGSPGPKRSRLSKGNLFKGITFYCHGSFNILGEDTLKTMLVAAGGRVVEHVRDINVTTASGPALLLAEPENTQEDRFIYLAMDSNIVPINYEWVLNCLGSYALSSIHDWLLCPDAVLNKNVQKWPSVLIAIEDD